jgi:Ca2+-binding EF-hand superfamily protein
MGNAELSRRMEMLQAKNEQLLRENVQLRRSAGAAGPISGESTLLQNQLADAQDQLKRLMQENVQLRRDGASWEQTGADAAELIGARRQTADLRARLDQLLQENVQLQRSQSNKPGVSRPDGPLGGFGLGQFADDRELGHLRKLHDENRAQRKTLELVLARLALDSEAGAAFAPLVDEVQKLERQVADLSDENVTLRLRLPQTAGTIGGGVLPTVPPVAPGSLQEVQEANAILRAKFEAVCNDQVSSARRLREVAGRVDELLAENVQLQRQLQRPANLEIAENETARALEEAQAARERAEKKHLASAERLRLQTGRVAEITAERDTLRQKFHESTIREFALTRQGRSGTGGELRSADDESDRQYLLAKVDSLQNENEELRHWADRQQQRSAENQGEITLQFKKDHAGLMEKCARLSLQNESLQREVGDLQRERALRPTDLEEDIQRAAILDEDLRNLKSRNDELERENLVLRQMPEKHLAVFDSAKLRIEESGVTFLQILRSLDVKKQGCIPFVAIEFALRKLPIQLPKGGLTKALASSVSGFHDNADTVRYIDWVEYLVTLPPGEAFAPANGKLSPRALALRNGHTMGVVDEAQQLRGFSLRAALSAVDQDEDGLIQHDHLLHAFSVYFEFLQKEDIDMLVDTLVANAAKAKGYEVSGHLSRSPISLMDIVWSLDTAFLVSRGQVDAMQSLLKIHAQAGPAFSQNPLVIIREYLRKKCAGEHAPLRRIFNAFDPCRTGFITLRAFKALLRNEVGLTQHSDEELDFCFREVDRDGDDALTFREFEQAVTGEDKQKQINDMLNRLGAALRREDIRIGELLVMFDLDNSGELDRSEIVRLLERVQYKASEAEINVIMEEFDADASGTISITEFRNRMEQARCTDLIDEFKSTLKRLGISPLDAFQEADADGSGTVTFAEFEALFVGTHRINMPRAKLRELFDAFDLDRSGEVSYREFLRSCGLRSAYHHDGEDREYLPRGDGPPWVASSLQAIKKNIICKKRDDQNTADAARQLLMQFDERGAGCLSCVQFRRALAALGIETDMHEVTRLLELICPRDTRQVRARGAQQGQRPQHGQRPQRGVGAGREMRIDLFLSRLEAVSVPEEGHVRDRMQARPAAESLRAALQKRGLSLVAILADLDPAQHGQISFESLRIAANRHRLGLTPDDLDRLKAALRPSTQGRFATNELLRLIRVAEDADRDKEIEHAGGGKGFTENIGVEALEGLPPQSSTVSAPRRARSMGGTESRLAAEREIGSAEARHRRQVDALNASLRQAEEKNALLQRELNAVKHQEAQDAQKAAQEKEKRNAAAGATAPQPLHVLLAGGESAATIKELRLEVQGTHDLRDKLFAVESELEECRRRLHVDARAELDREQQKNLLLQNQLEERERVIAHLGFDLKRARAAADSGDVTEEYQMTLSLQNRRLEEEMVVRKKSEAELMEKLLEQEHQTMEFRFEREQNRSRASRLENRLLELELLATSPMEAGGSSPTSRTAAPSRQVRSLEQVIEGLNRVIAQQKIEQKRLKDALDAKKDDRRHRAEVAGLRKKISALEEELGAHEQQQRRSSSHGAADLNRARSAQTEAQAELREKEAQIAGLEQQIRNLVAARPSDTSGSPHGGAESGDVVRLEAALQELRLAREADAMALDEAQRALHEAELTEKRYVEVARENKKLRAEIGALEDEGFWQELESLHARSDEGTKLLRESREALCSLFGAFPSLEPPSGLLARIDRHVSSAAASAA